MKENKKAARVIFKHLSQKYILRERSESLRILARRGHSWSRRGEDPQKKGGNGPWMGCQAAARPRKCVLATCASPIRKRLTCLCLVGTSVSETGTQSAMGGYKSGVEMGGHRWCDFHWAVIPVWEFEESIQDTFQGLYGKEAVAAEALIYHDSQTSFFSLQSILHAAARGVRLKHQSGHVPSLLKTPYGSRLPLDFGEVWNPKRHFPGFIFWAAFALSSSPTLDVDAGPLSMSLNTRFLCASGLCLLCSSHLKTLPHTSFLQ